MSKKYSGIDNINKPAFDAIVPKVKEMIEKGEVPNPTTTAKCWEVDDWDGTADYNEEMKRGDFVVDNLYSIIIESIEFTDGVLTSFVGTAFKNGDIYNVFFDTEDGWRMKISFNKVYERTDITLVGGLLNEMNVGDIIVINDGAEKYVYHYTYTDGISIALESLNNGNINIVAYNLNDVHAWVYVSSVTIECTILEPSSAKANKLVGFDNNGNPSVVTPGGGSQLYLHTITTTQQGTTIEITSTRSTPYTDLDSVQADNWICAFHVNSGHRGRIVVISSSLYYYPYNGNVLQQQTGFNDATVATDVVTPL